MPLHSEGMVRMRERFQYCVDGPYIYSATREDDTTFIFSHFGIFLSDAASNSHK